MRKKAGPRPWRAAVLALGVVLAAAALVLPSLASGRAQEGARGEAARIERRLERIEARVLREDAGLRRLDEALGAALLAGMEAVRPGTGERVRLLASLEERAAAAGGADPGRIRRLRAEVEAARLEALADPRLAAMVDAFQALLRERMLRADPGAARLLARYAELHPEQAAGADAAP